MAPYGFISLLVVLETLGGIGLLMDPAGLLWLKRRADLEPFDTDGQPMDGAFLVLLGLTSLTGLALLALRQTPSMSMLLAVHLGIVMALFLTLPYGHFVHGIYRFFAFLHAVIERERNKPSGAGE